MLAFGVTPYSIAVAFGPAAYSIAVASGVLAPDRALAVAAKADPPTAVSATTAAAANTTSVLGALLMIPPFADGHCRYRCSTHPKGPYFGSAVLIKHAP